MTADEYLITDCSFTRRHLICFRIINKFYKYIYDPHPKKKKQKTTKINTIR